MEAPRAAMEKSRFAPDCLSRNHIKRFIMPIVKQAVAAADHKTVIMLKFLPKKVNSYIEKV